MAEDVYVKVKRSDAEAIRTALQMKTGGSGAMTAPTVAAGIAALTTVGEVDIVDSGTSTTVTN